MGLFIRNQDTRSELQARIAAELQEKLREQPTLKAEKVDPAFSENQHHTRPAGILIVTLILVAIIIIAVSVSR